MPLRTLLIRIMLGSLGVTAVAGALAALVGIGDFGGRIVGTGLIAAFAAGLMLPFSFLADKPKTRVVGLLGMTLVILEFAGSLGLLWEIFNAFGGYTLDEQIGATMFFLGFTVLPALVFMRVAVTPAGRVAGIAGIALFLALFALLMIPVWIDLQDNWYETAAALGSLGMVGVACLAGFGTQPRRWWRLPGFLAAVAAFIMATIGIWERRTSGGGLFTFVVSIAAVIAHANICLMVPLTGGQRWVRIVTIASAITAAIFIDVMAFALEYQFEFAIAMNLAAAAGIIASCGSLALLVMARINRNLDRVPVLSEIRELTLICPGCKKKQTVPVGESSCPTCRLAFKITLEEPRCSKCDYLLFMLQSDRCPECGEPVAAQLPAG